MSAALQTIFKMVQAGLTAKQILSSVSEEKPKIGATVNKLLNLGYSAENILHKLSDKKGKTRPQLFTTDFGKYLNEVENANQKDYNRLIKGLSVAGVGAAALTKLFKKYPAPEIQVEEFVEPESQQAPVAQQQLTQPVSPPQLPAPPEVVRAEPGEVITPPITPQQRGEIKRFEALKRLQPEMTIAEGKAPSERQPSAISPQPQQSAPQPSAPVPQIGSQPILFETETYKQMPGPGNTIRQLVQKGFNEKTIERFVTSNLKKYATRFELETGKSMKQEIRDLIAKAPPKPKQLFTSKEDKKIQDAGLKPKLKPMRKKQEMGDFMKQVQESARPTESLTAPTDRQAFMNSLLELQNLLRGS